MTNSAEPQQKDIPLETATSKNCLFGSNLGRVYQSARMFRTIRAALVTTRDRDQAHTEIKTLAIDHQAPLYCLNVANRKKFNPSSRLWERNGGATPAPAELFRQASQIRGGGLVILEDCLGYISDQSPDPSVRMALVEMLSAENNSDGLVLVFVESPESERQLPAILADQFVRFDVPYPRHEELVAIAREELAFATHLAKHPVEINQIRIRAKHLAKGMVGLTRSAARDALRDALMPDPSDFTRALNRLNERKTQQLKRELAMNILDASYVDLPVGLDYLFDYLKIVQQKITLEGPERARGIFLVGPPGTGKTMLARTIGAIISLPVVEFRISSLMNSLLGETERRFAQAFSTLEAMAPNVVFIDEIDKAFGDSSERDGGTMMRTTGSLLSWLSDNPRPNFIVATSNSLERMGEIGMTMTRSERFDACFFVDVPNYASRYKMLCQWLDTKIPEAPSAARIIAAMTEKFSGADIRSITKQAIARAEYEKTPLTLDHLHEEVNGKKLRAETLYDKFEWLRSWGKMYCNPAGPTDNSIPEEKRI